MTKQQLLYIADLQLRPTSALAEVIMEFFNIIMAYRNMAPALCKLHKHAYGIVWCMRNG
jgi:hypothetical protein